MNGLFARAKVFLKSNDKSKIYGIIRIQKRKEIKLWKSYKKYWEYKITLASISEDELTRFLHDPRLNGICVCKDHYVANMRFRKNINRPNRIRNVRYTMECWNRHLQKKGRK